jgi:putative spermidine/putrescine transport system permease protein
MPGPSLGMTMKSGIRRHITPYLLVAAPACFLLTFFVIPSVVLLSMSVVQSEDTIPTGNLTLDNFATLLSTRLYLRAILRSVFVGIASGAIVVILAYPLAYFLVRTTSRWKNLLIALSLAPLLASVIVRTYGWWVILNREGALNVALRSAGVIDHPLIMLPSTLAIIVGLAHALLPYGVLTIMASLNGLNPSLERAAMSLGAGRARTFLSVTLPLTAPGIAGGFLLTFAIAMSAYATPAILGGPSTEVMATMIRRFMLELLDWSLGSAMGAILLVSAMILLLLTTAFGNRERAP